MKKTTFILAAIASAIAAFGTLPAQAGGKRLQFGGPLGSFEATPYAKSSNRATRHYSKTRSSRAAAKRAHARKLAARKAAARKAAAKKAAAHKYAAQKAARQAAARKLATQKAASAKARTVQRADVKRQKQESDTAENNETSTKAAPVKASAIAGTNTLKLDDNADETDLAAIPDTEPETAKVENENAELQCKKYIPSAGMTISVPCGS